MVLTTSIQADWHFERIECEVTAYTTSYEDCGKIDGITTSGTIAKYGTIAAPPHIDFGTKIIIDNEHFVVEDRGSAIIQRENGTSVIDMWLPSTEECKQYGRQYKTCWMVIKNK